MEKAAEKGADDVINVRIDKTEIFEGVDIEDYMSGDFKERKYNKRTILYTVSALAIKYTGAIVYPNASYKAIRDEMSLDQEKHTVIAQDKLTKRELWVKANIMATINSTPDEHSGSGDTSITSSYKSDYVGYGFEVDGVQFLNESIGFGVGIELSSARQEMTKRTTITRDYGYGNSWTESYSNYEEKTINPFDIFGIFVLRLDFAEFYVALGTKQSLGIQKTFYERLIVDLSYNSYPLHEKDGFFKNRQSVNISAGYKFKLNFL